MNSTTSPHAVEDSANRCPVCQAVLDTRPCPPPGRSDCPHCGQALWFVRTSRGIRCYEAALAAPLEEKVVELLCEHLGVKPENVSQASALEADLGADSLAVVEVMMAVEEELGYSIPDDDAQKMKTVGDLVDYLCRPKKPSAKGA